MPVTKTAKRALRGSKAKELINQKIKKHLEIAIRLAKKTKSAKNINAAFSYADRAVKKNLIHKNKASRIKGSLSKLLPKKTATKKSK